MVQTSDVNARAKKNKCTETLYHEIIASKIGECISLFIIYTELSTTWRKKETKCVGLDTADWHECTFILIISVMETQYTLFYL